MSASYNDILMNNLFADLERMKIQAVEAGDLELAHALTVALANSLESYCDAKRQALDDRIGRRRSHAA